MEKELYIKKWADKLNSTGMGGLSAFILRAHLPITGFIANAAMFGEPFLKMFDVNVEPFYEVMRDRNAVEDLIRQIESKDNNDGR